MGPTVALRDTLRSHYALAHRLLVEFEAWENREGSRAPKPAVSLARLAASAAKAMANECARAEASQGNGTPFDLSSLVGLASRATVLEELHGVLDQSTYGSMHPVFGPMVETEAQQLGVTGTFIVSGTRDVSYEIITLDRDQLSELAPDDALDRISWPVRIFRVPHRPLDWPLHHALLYHELGHAAYEEIAVPPVSDFDPDSKQDTRERLQEADQLALYNEFMASWIEEMYADAIGVLLGGPAYALAFTRFLCGFFAINAASETHPPISLRVELIMEIVRQEGYLDQVPEPARELLSDWSSLSVAANNYEWDTFDDVVLPILVRESRTIHASVVQLARARVGTNIYPSSAISDDIIRGDMMSKYGIPAIEMDELGPAPRAPLPNARVFGAAWMAYVNSIDGNAALDQTHRSAARIADVLLGSLDGASALRLWNRVV